MHNIIKKSLAAVLCIALCFVTISAMAFTDTTEHGAKNEIDFIAGYGIIQGYEDGNFYPDNAITRAEMVAIALRMIRLDNPISSDAYGQSFPDVPEDYWAYGAIETAVALGIVNGYPDGTFKPGNYVTYSEAIKILVTLLGYEPAAEAKGGYSAGYIAIASAEDLINLSGINVNDFATRGAIAAMVYNALQTEMMLASYYGEDGVTYTKSDKTMLDIYFNSYQGRGLITATEVEGLYGDAASANHIEIDGVSYYCEDDYNDLLGERVIFFYTDEGEKNEIVFISSDAQNQRKITVTSDRFEAFTGVYTSKGKFAYYEKIDSGKAKTVDLSPSMSLIYNNEYIPYDNLGSVDLDIKLGTIDVIDNDFDGNYDCVKILSYKDYYVNSTSENEETKYITDGSGSGFVYEIEDVYEKITMNGVNIDFADIPKNSIASVADSPSRNAVVIVISQNQIEGTIDAKSVNGVEKLIWVNDAKYTVSRGAPERYVDTTIGVSGVFHLNFMGQVAYTAEKGDDGEFYGYFTEVGKKNGGIDSTVQVRMLTENNTFAILDVADKVKFYDKGVERTITDEEFYNEFYDVVDEWEFREVHNENTQVVKYKLNSDGKLVLIRTAKETPDTKEFSYGYVNPVSGEAEGRRYYANRLFMQGYQITDDTVCFEIPWTAEGEDYTRYESGKAPNYFSDGNYYQVLLFDVNEQKQIGAIMLTKYGQDREFFFGLSSNSPVMIVDSMHYVLNEKTGNSEAVICGLVDGEYTSEVIDPDFMGSMNANMFKFGSALRYDTNEDKVEAAYYEGESPSLAAASLLCADGISPETIKWNGGNVEMTSANCKTTYGTVRNIVGFTVTVNVPDYPYGDSADYFMNESMQIIIADTRAKTLDIGNFYDIRPGDRIFIRERYNRIRDVVVYR